MFPEQQKEVCLKKSENKDFMCFDSLQVGSSFSNHKSVEESQDTIGHHRRGLMRTKHLSSCIHTPSPQHRCSHLGPYSLVPVAALSLCSLPSTVSESIVVHDSEFSQALLPALL